MMNDDNVTINTSNCSTPIRKRGLRIGDIVETTFGVGVIIRVIQNDVTGAVVFYHVRMWRIPGKSLGSSCLAILQPTMILRRLPVAPGMTTMTTGDNPEKVLVLCYYASQNQYLVSSVVEQQHAETAEDQQKQPKKEVWLVQPGQLQKSISAKFYPLLEELMYRGEQAAASVTEFWQENSESITKVVEGTKQSVSETADQVVQQSAAAPNPDQVMDKVKTELTDKVIPSAEKEFQAIMTMLKDEELTTILSTGRERLEQLVSQDVSQTTQTALQGLGVRLWSGSDDNEEDGEEGDFFSSSMAKSQKAALTALDDFLANVGTDKEGLAKNSQMALQLVQDQLGDKFQTMMDAFSDASRSDPTLSNIFDTLSDKASLWEETTGRILTTKSASLFLEGASRIQARAAHMFFQTRNSASNEIQNVMSSKLTKAFTEGDAAVARLKSIELGDAVRNRLVQAIEVRSESLGGLDGIIAGALQKQVPSGGDGGDENQIQTLLASLQIQATSVTEEANETLLSVLSGKSLYQDIALLRLEEALCDLEVKFFGVAGTESSYSVIDDDEDGNQNEESWSAEDLVALARGEGGTSKLFEPISKRAMKEIEKQLELAEANIATDNKHVLEVLSKVRKIMSGQLTLGVVMDDLVHMLNDDSVVAAGSTLVQHGENVLDAIESGMAAGKNNQLVSDAMQIAEKAGITKDSVMKELEKLNMDEILDTAGSAVTDERKRVELLSSATDIALDFFLRVLPSMPVPPFDGVRDGLVYNFSNLSMEGFKVKKEDISIEIAGMRATDKRNSVAGKKQNEPDGEDASKEKTENEDCQNEIKESPSSDSMSTGSLDITTTSAVGEVKATELLIIDITNISAILDKAKWGLEQTYFPYLKGNGEADVKLSDGSIRLNFELRKQRKRSNQTNDTEGKESEEQAEEENEEKEEEVEWEPVLCLHDRTCEIGEVHLILQGEGRIVWLLNKVTSYLKGPLGVYVARQIVAALTQRSGWILERMNHILSPYWDLIMTTAGLTLDGLVEADEKVVVSSVNEGNLVELVWRESNPLGVNLLLGDGTGLIKVVDFARGSQARSVAEQRQIDPNLFKGAVIVAVNGIKHQDQDELYDALKDPGRPKSIMFELVETEEAEKLQDYVQENFGDVSVKRPQSSDEAEVDRFVQRTVEFHQQGELGIEFAESVDNYGLMVRRFIEGEGGTVLAAERNESLHIGDLLTHINGKPVLGENCGGRNKALKLLETEGLKRPLTLTFVDPYITPVVFEKASTVSDEGIGGPAELLLEQETLSNGDKRIVITACDDVTGAAESGGIFIGDHLVFLNGLPVGAGTRWIGEGVPPSLDEINEMLQDKSSYPIGLTFARRKKTENRWGSILQSDDDELQDGDAETICVTADRFEQLGCLFETNERKDIKVTDFYAVPGNFQTIMKSSVKHYGKAKLAIEAVNGQYVPSYASKDMVRNALKRSWNSDGRVEVLCCDNEMKDYVHGFMNTET